MASKNNETITKDPGLAATNTTTTQRNAPLTVKGAVLTYTCPSFPLVHSRS